jgi:hypothetical protein
LSKTNLILEIMVYDERKKKDYNFANFGMQRG